MAISKNNKERNGSVTISQRPSELILKAKTLNPRRAIVLK